MEKIETLNGSAVQQGATGNESEVEMLKSKLDTLTKETNQFTYIITHDLQAPLRMVTGFLELLEKKYAAQLDEGARQYIEYAVKGSVKMKNLIFDLLEYSRLSSVVHEFEPVKLDEIVKELKEKKAKDIEDAGAIIVVNELPVVRGSQKLIAQLLGHLMDNALKYRKSDIPEIFISAEKKNKFWEIAVKDNGMGIDPAFFEKIFVIFKKLHTDEARYPGTGTGLAVCKKIAELHGGTIRVSSAVGEGSTFYFTLPLS
jgi:light-regulated signal transduction histidine kinase (bacteriophytochrome)